MNIRLPKISLLITFSVFFLIIFLIFTIRTTHANEFVLCQKASWTDAEVDYTGTNTYVGTFECAQNTPANFCTGPGDSPPYAFYFNPTCNNIHFDCTQGEWLDSMCTSRADCTWQQNLCAAVDRCDTGYSRASAANSSKVYAGQCDINAYRAEQGPQSACVSGGQYKVCCTGAETPANPTPRGWCDVQPYVRTCNPGSPTSPGITSCVTSVPVNGGWTDWSSCSVSCGGGTQMV